MKIRAPPFPIDPRSTGLLEFLPPRCLPAESWIDAVPALTRVRCTHRGPGAGIAFVIPSPMLDPAAIHQYN